MKTKSVLFNNDAVAAVLNNDKSTFRIPVKPQSRKAAGFYVTTRKCDGAFMGVYDCDENEAMFDNSQTPPYCADDILYVREAWRIRNMGGDFKGGTRWAEIEYRAGGPNITISCLQPEFEKWRTGARWHPALQMPQKAARIFLRVTDVTVKRLQEISDDEIASEGIWLPGCLIPKDEFAMVWDNSLSPKKREKYGWKLNPYVWVVSFEQCDRPKVKDGEF